MYVCFMKTHKDLQVWNQGISLVRLIYKKCSELPESEKYGIENQLKRAAISVPTNIAEGAARNHQKEYR